MDTETGRIYPPDEMDERLRAKELHVMLDEHQAEFEKRFDKGMIVEVSDEVAARLEQVGEGECPPQAVRAPRIMGATTVPRGAVASHDRKLVVMEWIVGEGNVGLAMEFYVAKGPDDAAKLRERLQALELPSGAVERTVHIQPARRWPLTKVELLVTLAQHKTYAAAIIAGREAEQSNQEVADVTSDA